MKCIIVVLASVALAQVQCFTDKQKETIKQNQELCASETGVPSYLIEEIEDGNWNIDNYLLKKWFECLMIKSNILTSDGASLITDAALLKVPKEDWPEIKQLVSKCYDRTLQSPELAWNFSRCYQTSNPKHSIF